MPSLSMRRATPLALLLVACGPARVELDPTSVQLFGRGQVAHVHATPMSGNGRPMPEQACRWTSSDEKVATVTAHQNDAAVTAVGHGRATVRCAAGKATAEAAVTVTLVTQVEVKPALVELRLLDEAQPTPLAIRALDGEGRELAGRVVVSRCLDENVCRGDARGQLWPVGPGATRAVVRVDDGEGAVEVRVTDARSAAGRPRSVKGNPMEHIADPTPPARRRK